jgi:hypothetical protein
VASWEQVEAAVRAWPETEAGSAYGYRAWRMRKKLLVWERPLRRAEREALGARAPVGEIAALPTEDLAEKDELLASLPAVFFTTPHFDGYPAVLARLELLPVDVLEALVAQAWRRAAPRRLAEAHGGPRSRPSG